MIAIDSRSVARGVVRAPLTHAWLLVLLVTTRVQRSAGERGSRRLQERHSTNLRRLNVEPLRALADSLFWLDGQQWWPYVPAFVAVVAPAEKRLGWWRWLLVGTAAHAIATFVGQGHLRLRIRKGRAPRRLVNARDVGVSYFMLGVAGALTGYVPKPWRSRCQAAGVAGLAVNAAIRPTFTEVGHLAAFVAGVGAAPFVPESERHAYPNFEWLTYSR